ncbi:IclR family transcriptional regulator [Brucella pituitosa]|uniref:IclR family transcriptional regulator n=1 Tax=Brucella pituitosa TaxID=571256 RepID=A0ABS3K627_9HYPH|nr:IclR family transcriptional regulator [Brucella pituitosa]MBO1042357.1 IclR family transcriptional regulator [Brucella pituitosa]
MTTPRSKARIQSIARAKDLLDAMAGGEWVSLKRLSSYTGLAKTSAFNLVSALVDVGLAERNVGGGEYRLGLQHLVYGKAVERRIDIAAIARPHLLRLCAITRETLNLAVPGPTYALIVDSFEGSQALRVTSYSGTCAPYHSTACGRALLAHQSEAFRHMLYSFGPLPAATPATLTNPEALERLLAQCRSRGWTIEFEENEPGSACIAAPIFNHEGEAIASVSIAGPSSRFDAETIERLGPLLVTSLAKLTADLPYSTPNSGPAR